MDDTDHGMTVFEKELMARVCLRSEIPDLDDDRIVEMLQLSARLSSGKPPALCDLSELPKEINGTDLVIRDRQYEPQARSNDVVEQALDILLNKNVRRGAMAMIEPFVPEFRAFIQRAVGARQPIDLSVLALAAKASNPLSTGHPVQDVDLGEAMFVGHMRDVLHSLHHVYTPGARLVIVSDALAYVGHRTALEDTDRVIAYVNGVRELRDEAGLREVCAILDLKTLAYSDPNFDELRSYLAERFRDLYDAGHEEVVERLDSLARNRLTYIPLPAFDLETTNMALRTEFADLPEDVRRACFDASINLSSFTSALYLLRITQRALPDVMRMTVHPKPAAQLPIWMTPGDVVLPHNGVPVVNWRKLDRSEGDVLRSTRVVHRREVLMAPETYAVNVAGKAEPYYYAHE